MSLPLNFISATYTPSFGEYAGNPFIEALPPIMQEIADIKANLIGKVDYNPEDILRSKNERIHLTAQLIHQFFQPITRHISLESKISILIRQGYIGRNIADGKLHQHLQNGYERIMSGDIKAFRFDAPKSTALSYSLIGCSGSGKSTTLHRILNLYPQVIYHEKYNFTQLVYLKIDCPHDGSLKNLCLHFFKAIDVALGTDFERKVALKRLGIEALLNYMRQITNTYAIGVLVIDEIQHLSVKNSGGAEKMLNFFVTLINVVGLPVVMVGTPKAKFIFDGDLRSARRGAGFGADIWEPMKNHIPSPNTSTRTEWTAFTNALWKYQWLTNKELLSDEIRDCWYELSQGVLDIVVKLFVLAQCRAIMTGLERITPRLLRQVYEDELKFVHPMIEALKSGDPNRIALYSDLTIPYVDKTLLLLQRKIEEEQEKFEQYNGNEQAQRLHNLLIATGYPEYKVVPVIKKAFADFPQLNMQELMPIVSNWLIEAEVDTDIKPATTNRNRLKQNEWIGLSSDDLRFKFSQKAKQQNFYDILQSSDLIFDTQAWLQSM
ncbi:AAA family ATPase [Acinetobacter soli]|uniref:AAA family ATPase n=1 Tax=Acinetobacter soli TaxID=487316 RepID=UPI003B897CA7